MTKKYNYIYLKDNTKAYFLRKIKNANFQDYYMVNEKNPLFRWVRKKAIKSDFYWGKWKKHVKDYDYFILGENSFNPQFTRYIKKQNPNARIIMFIWNAIVPWNSNKPNYQAAFKDKNLDEIWSFDRNDAKTYNLPFNTQFYSNEFQIDTSVIDNDIVFIGRDKGRLEKIRKLEEKFQKMGLKTDINVVLREKDYVPYEKYLETVGRSKAILSVMAGHQVGLDLRAMESIFFEKKYITTNKDIVNYDFYDPQNIFVIGKDKWQDFKEFINSPYKKIDAKIVNGYDFHNWIKRFGIEEYVKDNK